MNFLLIERIARLLDRQILLRIDDLDHMRVRREYIRDIFDSLEWLQINWHAGPKDPIDHERNWSQQFRLSRYTEVLDRLRDLNVLYACTCSRSELQSIKNDEHRCRDRSHDLDHPAAAWRIRIEKGTSVEMYDLKGQILKLEVAGLIGDTVVRQRSVNGTKPMPAFQIASLADDVDRKISLIVRGMDLLPSTVIQLHLASLLGFHEFSQVRFWHHPLIRDPSGMKLSKSDGASSLKAMRDRAMNADVIRTMAIDLFDLHSGLDQIKPIA